MKTVRVYKAEIMAVEANELHYREIESFPNMADTKDGEVCTPEIREHIYPIRQWGQIIGGAMIKTRVCLADDLLQEIFEAQETNLQGERESLSIVRKILDKYYCASFWQRLKYLFSRRIN